MCRLLKVSPSGYYAWRTRKPSPREQENKMLVEHIQVIHQKSHRSYGSPRVTAELRAMGFEVGRHRMARLMQQQGICGVVGRRFRKTTDSNHKHGVAPNLLQRNFHAECPDQAWVADISTIWTMEGWLYLSVIVDLFSRRVVGWSMDKTMTEDLVHHALRMALGHRVPCTSGLVFHSDRGSQYAAIETRKALKKAGITCSMSRRANCWDNAVAESFFATLKKEFVYRTIFTTRAEAKTGIAEYIEVFYNRQRRHSNNGYLSPIDFENQFYHEKNNHLAA